MSKYLNYRILSFGVLIIALALFAFAICTERKWDTLFAALIGGLLSAAAVIFTTGLALEGASAQLREEVRVEREASREARLAALKTEIKENILQLKRKEPNREINSIECAPLSDSAWNDAKGLLQGLGATEEITRAYISVRRYNSALATYKEAVVARGGGVGQVPITETRDALQAAANALGIKV